MQSSSAEVTMMESQNRKRAPAWTEREVQDLIAVWGEESVLSELRSSFRNAKTFVKISQGMKNRGHNRDPKQCRMKLKELRQAYQKTRGANGRSRHFLAPIAPLVPVPFLSHSSLDAAGAREFSSTA
ncbi:hypothetical protein UY3_12794 [Chelonia mydas]|uniref:Myb/SANT-like DNA-binding domain-containing protein n=1 Tax=Chelonia mydas TaxID=8469 RepID=M7BD71_CHEMY|nr:hypothetical protein UY3_12794 [Chelonia mydas]